MELVADETARVHAVKESARASLANLTARSCEREECLDDAASALQELQAAAIVLKAAFRFIDVLDHNIHTAATLAEATERRLEAHERAEQLPPQVAQLPPVQFEAHQFTQQLRRRHLTVPPELPELELLPPSRAAHGSLAPDLKLPANLEQLERVARAAADDLERKAREAAVRATSGARSLWTIFQAFTS